ncbi:MAG: hypothetical protein A4E68_00434 [Syntrophaceae bacterium PtaB.Bin095]|nr:MAG: hypothetical protein A4E68_00434 [Syntrophaceae bacterium PtaB.Bin095]
MLDGPVRPMPKPVGVLGHVRVVRRALVGEVQGDFQPVLPGRLNQVDKILERPEVGMDGLVAAFRRPNRPGTARILRAGCDGVVPALSLHPADGMDGRKVEHIETHASHLGKKSFHFTESAAPFTVRGD